MQLSLTVTVLKTLNPKLRCFCVFLGIAELTIRSFLFSLAFANLFSAILWKSAIARCLWLVLSQTAGTTNPIRAFWTLKS